MACQDVCPKDLPLLEVYAYLRRKALSTGMRRPRQLLQIQASPGA
jgi:heterodisulfide reductase subunit C